MRRAPLLALLAVLATTALGLTPVVAAAKSVTLNDASGKPLQVGVKVYGTSTDTLLTTETLLHSCPKIEFSSELVYNGGGAEKAMVEKVTYPTFKCYFNTPQGWWYTRELIGLKSKTMTFLTNNSVQYSFESGIIKTYWAGGSLTCEIDPTTSSGGGTWVGGLLPEPALIEYANNLKVKGCPSSASVQMSGTFDLTDKAGQPIDIVVK